MYVSPHRSAVTTHKDPTYQTTSMELLLTSFASFVRQTLVHDTNYTVTNTEMTLSMARGEVHKSETYEQSSTPSNLFSAFCFHKSSASSILPLTDASTAPAEISHPRHWISVTPTRLPPSTVIGLKGYIAGMCIVISISLSSTA